MDLDRDFWNGRYVSGQMGWDIGYPSTPIREFIDTLGDRELEILIPGCGNAYEAEYLHLQGFRNVHVIDIAPLALEGFSERVPGFPEENLILGDFFGHDGQYDLILEQTFFCGLNPVLRTDYAEKMHGLLKPRGMLAGLMFCIPLHEDHPPFGGDAEEYRSYFAEGFEIISMEPCKNSIESRHGSELWVEIRKL